MKVFASLITTLSIQQCAAARWDVDIPDQIAESWIVPIYANAVQARKKWADEKRAYFRDAKFHGYEREWDEEDAAEEHAQHAIESYLRSKLGRPAYFDSGEQFVPAEYVSNFGKVYQETS